MNIATPMIYSQTDTVYVKKYTHMCTGALTEKTKKLCWEHFSCSVVTPAFQGHGL